MKLRRFASLLLVVVLLSSMAVFGTSAADTEQQATGAYSNMGKYSNMTYNGTDLGANYTKAKTTFKVWSPEATKIEVKLYRTGSDREKGAGVIGTFPMTKGSSGVWSYDYAGDHKNEYYTYLVTAKNIYGSVATLETQDIYSKAVGVNGERSMIVDLDSTDPEGWADDQHVVFDNSCQSNVYELHVRDFSADPDCGVSEANQGNFLAFTEGGTTYKKQGKLSTCIDYLVENNIRTVQLMPIADFTSVDEVYSDSADIRNWGYDPKNYNVPDGVYSSNAYDGNVRIKECKQMIQALHDRGISVIMDVVYNHTAGYESTAFSRIVPGYYYRMSGNNYVDGTGCGCEFATENAMVRNFIVQSLAYWADEYHMDGFRFDLMACIDVETLNAARTKLNSLFKGAEKMPMYGEPWTGGDSACTKQATKANVGSLKSGVGLFCADMRDAGTNIEKTTTQGWVGGNTASTATVVSGIKGDLIQSTDNTKEVNYAECHDKYTIWDKLVGAKTTSGEGKETKSVATNVNSTSPGYISQLKLTAALFMTSQGIKFMQAGSEFARTKQGQENSYNSGDKINMLDWKRAQTYSNSVEYYKGLRQIQEVYTPFNDDTNKSKGKISMKSSSGSLIAYTIDNATANASKEWGTVAVILNSGSSQATANLGASGWKVVANDTQAGVKALSDVSGSSYSVPGKSAAILVKADGYKDLSDRFKYGTLTTKHIVNGKEYKTVTAKYRIGTKYRALKDEELLIRNNVTSTDGTPSGTFSGDTTVTFNYESNGKTMGTIRVNYVDQAKKEVVPGLTYVLEKGEAYNIPVGAVQGYQLDTDKYPLNTYGKFSGQDTTITFTYKPIDVKQTIVHYKNTSKYSLVFCYAYTDDGKEPLGAWSSGKTSKGLMTSEGNNWYKITVPIASCRVMFHGNQNNGEGQEPGKIEPGYPVSGEAKIENRVVTSENTLIVSHIDIDTGKKLKEAVQEKGVKSITDKYTTKEDTSCGRLVATPYNASGTFSSGAINVVYLYRNGADPTEPPTDAPTEPPTQAPTDAPTNAPTDAPSDGPTGTPTDAPSQAPTTDTAPATSGDSSLLGDSNCDTLIDVRDVTFIQQYLVNLAFFEEKNLRNSDVDGNGKITIKDASYIQRYLVKIDVPFKIGQPVETPAPTAAPADAPTAAPADTPTAAPADAPTAAPTAAPGQEVTETPTDAPGPDPTVAPEPDTEPETDPEPETDAPVPDKQQIVFTNNYGWSGDLTCHYWLGEQTFTEWPGEAMTNAGSNDYGEEQWSIELPVGCSFVITNGEVQTTDLTFTGSEVGFYPLKDSADAPPTTDAEGHYECGSY